ncbi:MAG: hypothetical protein ACXAD7_12950 [Candidatus Kariarchaeaceae archaeon]|jgi:hypothetical protein
MKKKNILATLIIFITLTIGLNVPVSASFSNGGFEYGTLPWEFVYSDDEGCWRSSDLWFRHSGYYAAGCVDSVTNGVQQDIYEDVSRISYISFYYKLDDDSHQVSLDIVFVSSCTHKLFKFTPDDPNTWEYGVLSGNLLSDHCPSGRVKTIMFGQTGGAGPGDNAAIDDVYVATPGGGGPYGPIG